MSSLFLTSLANRVGDKKLENKTAVKSGRSRLTYGQLWKYVERLSWRLQERTIPNKLVGLFTGDEPEVYAGLLGIVTSGNGYVPLGCRYPVERIVSIIELAELRFLVAANETPLLADLRERVPELTIINLAELIDSSPVKLEITPGDDPERLVYLLFTSGSTGKPKGVPIVLRNLDAFLSAILDERYGLGPDDQIMQMFELTFDFSVFPVFACFTVGATLHIVPSEGQKPLKVFEVLEEDKITVAPMVPSVINYLERFYHEISLPELRICVFCGEALYDNVLVGWANVCKNALQYNFYGPTEATVLLYGVSLERFSFFERLC